MNMKPIMDILPGQGGGESGIIAKPDPGGGGGSGCVIAKPDPGD